VSYSDSDWVGNPEARISVTGFIIYLLGVPICWRLKGQKGVEYIAMLETVKEIFLFIFF
jgi:hypothetical protein